MSRSAQLADDQLRREIRSHTSSGREARNKELNDEDEIHCGSASACNLTRNASYGSDANEGKHCTAPDVRDGGPRGCRSTLERRLYDRPRPKPVRSAHVDLW